MASVLRATGLHVSFGAVTAVADVDLTVAPGQLVGLIGPNGAGKTTTIDALMGSVVHGGRVRLGDRDLTDCATHERVRAGLGRTWQSLELFDDLSVLDNCRAAAARPTTRTTLLDLVRPIRRRDDSVVDWALSVLGIAHVAHRRPNELSLGQRKLVAVARSLVARPEVLLLDEPAAGLDSAESLRMGDQLRGIVDHDIGVLLVDHDMGLVLGVSDSVSVLEFGRTIATGTPAEIRADRRVVEAYLGEGHTSVAVDATGSATDPDSDPVPGLVR